MRKLLFIMCALFALNVCAQTRNAFCEVIVKIMPISDRKVINFHFGYDTTVSSMDDAMKCVDDQGNKKNFTSTVDALNWMGSLGYELVSTYEEIDSSNIHLFHFVMSKKQSDEEYQSILRQREIMQKDIKQSQSKTE